MRQAERPALHHRGLAGWTTKSTKVGPDFVVWTDEKHQGHEHRSASLCFFVFFVFFVVEFVIVRG